MKHFRKTLHLKSLRGFWICARFLICQGSEYSRNVSMPAFWSSRVVNMRWNAIMEGCWLFKDSEYARFQDMQALQKVLNMPEYSWIMCKQTVLTMAGLLICMVKVSHGFENASSSKYHRAWNMTRLWICAGYSGL